MPLTNKDKVAALRIIRDVLDFGHIIEIPGKMMVFLPGIVFLVGICKLGEVVDMFHEGALETVLKKIFMDSNLSTQAVKKIDAAIHHLGG